MSILVLRPTATKEILRILAFVEARSPHAARELLQELSACCQMLADRPRTGRILGSRRKWPCPPYIIVYRPIRGGIEVTRIVDGRRDLKKILR